jgi:glutathione S-transferase
MILHNYATSPFSEKVRVAFGIKNASWRSVEVPRILPKPDLMPLTGGYRKTPVMQVGADVYCDTQLILRELERRHPRPTFYPGLAKGLAEATAYWADHQVFVAAITVVFGAMADTLPDDLLADRSKFFGQTFERARQKAQGAATLGSLRAHLGWLEDALSDGRRFLYGDAPSLADLSVYHCVWYVRERAQLQGIADYAKLNGWADRMKGFGHGGRSELDAKAALAIAKNARPAAVHGVVANSLDLKEGTVVSVTPDDTGRDPVVGELVALDGQSVTIRRSAPEVGEVHVHFPRAGFIVVRHNG